MAFDVSLRDPGSPFDIGLSGGGTVESSFGLDAVISVVGVGSFGLDAVQERAISAGHSLDAVITDTYLATAQVDAVFLRTQGDVFATDADILAVQFGDTTAGAVKLVTDVGTTTLDALVAAEETSSLTLDALVRAEVSGSFSLDGVLEGVVADSLTADAVLLGPEAALFVAEALIIGGGVGAFTVDAAVLGSVADEANVDAAIFKVLDGQVTVEAALEAKVEGQAFVDAVIVAGGVGGVLLNAALQKQQSSQLSVDAVLAVEGVTNDVAVDATLLREGSDGTAAEATLLAHQESSFGSDAIVHGLGTGVYTLDAVVAGLDSFTLDAVIEGEAETFGVDALILGSADESFSIDAHIDGDYAGGSFSLDAYIQYGLSDDKASAPVITSVTEKMTFVQDVTGFTADADDPDAVRDWGWHGFGSFSAWLCLDLAEDTRVRIYTIIDWNSDGMYDTILGLWGPMASPPGAADDPWHLGDDNFPSGYLSSLHSSGAYEPYGTDFVSGDAYSEDTDERGVYLPAGKYWICVWPYDDDQFDVTEGPVRLVLEPAFIGGDFGLDAVIYQPHATLDAVIVKTQTGTTRPDTPQYISSTQTANWGQPNIVGSLPADVQDGDLLVATVVGNSLGTLHSVTSPGWTNYAKIAQPYTYQDIFVMTKVASSEPSSWTFTWDPVSTGSLAVAVVCIRNGEIVDYVGEAQESSTATKTAHSTPLLGVLARSIALAVFSTVDYGPTTTWTLDTDLTEIVDVSTYFAGIGIGYEDILADRNVWYTATVSNPSWEVDTVINVAGPEVQGIGVDAVLGHREMLLDAWIERTVVGRTYQNQPELIGTISGISSSGYTYLRMSDALSPLIQVGDLLIAVASFDEYGSERVLSMGGWNWNWDEDWYDDVEGSGWVLEGYLPTASHDHAMWVFSHVVTETEPEGYSFVRGGGFDGALAGAIMATRGGTLRDFVPGTLAAYTSSALRYTQYIESVPGSLIFSAFASSSYSTSQRWWLSATEIVDRTVAYAGLAVGYERRHGGQVRHSGDPTYTTSKLDYIWRIYSEDFIEGIALDALLVPMRFAADAVIRDSFASSFTLGASIVTKRAGLFFVRAVIGTAGAIPVNAVISLPFFALDAVVVGTSASRVGVVFVNSYFSPATDPGFSLDARISGVEMTRSGALVVRAWKDHAQASGAVFVDAWVDSYWSETTFTIDAIYVEPTRESSFAIAADISALGEVRGSFPVDALVLSSSSDLFLIYAQIEQAAPITLGAWVAGRVALDATIVYGAGDGAVGVDATVLGHLTGAVDVSGIIADAAGDIRQSNIDAVVLATVIPYGGIEVLARIIGTFTRTFTLGAVVSPGFSVSAWVQPYFTLGAYILGTSVVVFPPSQSGDDGSALGGGAFYSAVGEFDDSLVGSVVTIDGVDHTITSVTDDHTIVVSGSVSGSGLDWSIASGSPTDPVGAAPPVDREFRVTIEWSRPNRNVWTDVTGDVLWSKASFTQSARVGPGTFVFSMLGRFDEFVGGEEIRVSVDGFRVFGGYTLEVERGYVFEDDFWWPVTTLHGTDYNVVLDHLLVYNAVWDEYKGGSGGYRPWKPFPTETMDREIILTIADRYMSDPTADGFDFRTYVDEIETPAPVSDWTMAPGSTLRNVLTEISRITEGVWWIDPYKNLQYHDRSVVTAPFPITDGDGGISCRGLKIQSSLSVVSNDVIAWGTQAYMDTGDSDIIYSRQTADADWDEEYWQGRLDNVQSNIDDLRQTPASKRTLKQKSELAAALKAKAIYSAKVARAQADTTGGSVERLGRWQYAEVRQDIYHQRWLDRRARAIMKRYSEPVVKAEATVFDPGFQAGQVVSVVSSRHGVAYDLAIRESTLSFAVAKEPKSGKYFAVPQYSLTMGLDPEDPWDIYEYLPFNIQDSPQTVYNPTDDRRDPDPTSDPVDRYLDTFTRELEDGDSLGIATSERVEVRTWYESIEQSFSLDAYLEAP